MSLIEAKSLYESMLETGEIELMLPSHTGVWANDKHEFLKIYNLNQDILNDFDLDLDNYDYE